MGLSISRRLVELMGGEIGVTSELGVGSNFWFTARFAAVEQTSAELYPEQVALKGQRLLVVDDNATNRSVLMGQLLRCGTEAICAGSADEALLLLREAHSVGQPFQAALIDYQMPDCDGAQLGRRIAQDLELKTTRLILLTSSGQRDDGRLFSDIGFAGYLLKPVTQRDLTECLMLVLAHSAETWHSQTQPIVTRQRLRAQRSCGKNHILLAEDNLVNQKVATRLLEKMGYRVDAVADGHATFAAWQAQRYDLILMDCQMPEMDGFETTRQIRRLEVGTRRIPIVALTAHAMKGAQEACLAAGMDDYLSKPIDRDTLAACLERHLSAPFTEGEESAPVITHVVDEPSLAPGDWESLLDMADGDERFAHELIAQFLKSGRSSLRLIDVALTEDNIHGLGQLAHEIRGASASMKAYRTTLAAERLESAANAGHNEQLEPLAQLLRLEFESASKFLLLKAARTA